MRASRRSASLALAALCLAAAPPNRPAAPVFDPAERAVSTWRAEAADHLVLTPDQIAALRGPGASPRVARCVKLNNYWCIKRAGWNGELAADGEGHVAFASAVEGAAVAALLLKRYYLDFNRKSALAIISHWAPAQCGFAPDIVASPVTTSAERPRRIAGATAPKRLGRTLRARWLSSHPRGFVTPFASGARVKRSVVADHVPRLMPAPTIAVGLGEAKRPMTLDAMMMTSPSAPPSRSMIGMPRGRGTRMAKTGQATSLSACGNDSGRIAGYAAKAAAGITPGADGDLELFAANGSPTANLALMMANMSRVEIGPLGPTRALIESGIAAAFRPGRNPPKS